MLKCLLYVVMDDVNILHKGMHSLLPIRLYTKSEGYWQDYLHCIIYNDDNAFYEFLSTRIKLLDIYKKQSIKAKDSRV